MFLSKNTIKKPLTFKSKIFFDERGYFQELYLKKKINLSLKLTAVAYSKRGVVRGLHFQRNKQRAMLVSVLKGKINDYCVDLRKNSKVLEKYIKTLSILENYFMYPKVLPTAIHLYIKKISYCITYLIIEIKVQKWEFFGRINL